MNETRPLQIGDIIVGEFKILDIFGGEGKSGMGVVYLVEGREHPFPFVLKTFQRNDLDSTERFRIEAQTWISVGIHPNIVQALFVREINEQIFIGAEYIAPDEYGRNTITNFLDQGGASDLNAIRWTSQFCHAMDFARSKGLKAHRDIKPDNLMIDGSGNIKVTDFGLAKSLYDTVPLNDNSLIGSDPNLTAADSFLGTLLFASPEQILDSSSVDFRSDIYSFGVVLYQLISSNGFPYSLKGKTTLEDIAVMHLREPLVKISHPLFGIAEKCLAKDPNRRYQSYQTLLEELEVIAERLGIKMPLIHVQSDAALRELYIQSLSFLALGDKGKALELINKYIESDENDSPAWSLKGRILFENGKKHEGLDATLKSLELDPYNSRTLNNLGIFYGGIGEQDKGIAFLVEAIRVDGYNAGAVMNLAIACDKRGAYIAAADMTLKALELTPDKKTLHFNARNIAGSVMNNGQVEKAIPILETLIKLDLDNTDNWFNLGICYQLTNQKEKAIKCYEAVLDRIPYDEQSLIFLAQMNAELCNYDEALKFCEIMLENEVSPLKAISFKAQMLQAKGHGREAINFVKKVLNSGHQNNDNLWMLLGTLFEKEKHYSVAKKCLLQAKSIVLSQENVNQENIEYLNHQINKLEFFEEHSPEEIIGMLAKDKE